MFNEFAEGNGGSIPDLTAPSKEALIHLLRNESKWPESFGPFRFQNCGTCAMGLATTVWANAIPKKPGFAMPEDIADSVSDAIGISHESGRLAFFDRKYKNRLNISAQDVADMLETV